MHGVRTFFGVGYEVGGLCRGREALAGYLGGLSCRQGRGVSHTPPERHHRWRIHVPHSAPSGPPKRAYAIRPYSRVQALRVPSKLRRRPQAPPAILAGVRRRHRPYFAAGRIPPSSSPSTSWCAAVGRSIAGPERRAANLAGYPPSVPAQTSLRPQPPGRLTGRTGV